MSIDRPWGISTDPPITMKPISGRMTMTDEELAKMALPGAGTRRQAVEAFVLWTRDIEESDGVFQTLEENLCSCSAPVIPGVTPELRQDCPWCELRKAFGLLGDV